MDEEVDDEEENDDEDVLEEVGVEIFRVLDFNFVYFLDRHNFAASRRFENSKKKRNKETHSRK